MATVVVVLLLRKPNFKFLACAFFLDPLAISIDNVATESRVGEQKLSVGAVCLTADCQQLNRRSSAPPNWRLWRRWRAIN